MLVRCAHAGQTAWHDLAALSDKLPEQAIILVVDVLNTLDAELANFLAPEKLAAALAWRASGPAAKSATVASRAAGARTLSRCCLLWCFCVFCHFRNSPQSLASDSLSVASQVSSG